MWLKKFEFRLFFSAAVAFILIKIAEGLYSSPWTLAARYGRKFQKAGLHFEHFQDYLLPLLILSVTFFAAFGIINFRLMPEYRKFRNLASFLIGIGVILGILLAVTSFCYRILYADELIRYSTERGVYMRSLKEAVGIIMLFFLFYACWLLVRETIKWNYYRLQSINPRRAEIFAQVVAAAGVWGAASAIALFAVNDRELNWIRLFIVLLAPVLIFFFFFWTYYLIPLRERKKKRKFIVLPTLGVLVVSFFVFMIPYGVGTRQPAVMALMCFLFFLILFLVVWPMSRWYYNQQQSQNRQIKSLQTVVSRKTADLDFLRSQINPHFLFNALNTIYGTALQEDAERTAEGVQKLGDLMRFMLHENQQDQIPLEKEIRYLENYIELQKLRIGDSENISIEFTVNDKESLHQIAPMLLVPFVENAFKHGISLNEKSWIRIRLSCDADHIYFDMYNSVHPKQEGDPEKDRSGIGMENVRQRLELIYPDNHELSIRQTNNEYFAHLTIRV